MISVVKISPSSLMLMLHSSVTPTSLIVAVLYIGSDNSAIKCVSKKQTITATSSCEAELVAIHDIYKHVTYIANMLFQLTNIHQPIIWYCDNQAVIQLLSSIKPTSIKNSHIDVKYYYLREKIQNEQIVLNFISTQQMKADLLTKSIIGADFNTKVWWLLSPG